MYNLETIRPTWEINILDKRKEHMRGAYSSYWIKARTGTYGLMDYDLSIINLINETLFFDQESALMEVGIGTGWPIASSLVAYNYDISGIDISSRLISKCMADHPDIHAEVADAENLPYVSNSFDFTYCVHSSWFFTDLIKALSEMCRVTKPSGHVLIDIMNINNPYIKKTYQQHVFENTNFFGKLFKVVKNLAKFVLQSGSQDWPFLISQTPSDPTTIIKQCQLHSSTVRLYSWLDNNLKEIAVSDSDNYGDHSRIVICCKLSIIDGVSTG